MYFSWLPRKVPKEDALLRISRPALTTALEHRNLPPVRTKKCSDFCTKGDCGRKSAERTSWNSPLSVRLQLANKLCPLRCAADAKCAPGVVHRRGRLGSRERDTQRLSYADFFGYFLVRRQESNSNIFVVHKTMITLQFWINGVQNI